MNDIILQPIDKNDNITPQAKEKRYLIDPHSYWKLCFDLIASLLMIYFSVVIPYRLTFMDSIGNYFILYEQLFDLFLLLDVILRFFTAKTDGMNRIEKIPHIARSYIFGMFILDLIACFPFYLIFPYLY